MPQKYLTELVWHLWYQKHLLTKYMLETASIEQLKAIDNWALFNESGPRVFFRT